MNEFKAVASVKKSIYSRDEIKDVYRMQHLIFDFWNYILLKSVSSEWAKKFNNFWSDDATKKLQTGLESWIIGDFKNVHHFAVALFCRKLSTRSSKK